MHAIVLLFNCQMQHLLVLITALIYTLTRRLNAARQSTVTQQS